MIKCMYKKIITITLLTILFFAIICINNSSWAFSDITNSTIWDAWKPTIQDSTELTNKVAPILGVIRVVGVVISVATLAFIGIRFMCGSVEEKAKYKEQIIPWIIGATMVFTITTIPSIVYDLTENVTMNSHVEGDDQGDYSDYVRGYDEAVLNIAYAKLENYKSEVISGSSKRIQYDMGAFLQYLQQELEGNRTMYRISNNRYYQGICVGIEGIIKNKLGNVNEFIQYAEGCKEAVLEIKNGKITKQNIDEAMEEAKADEDWCEGEGRIEEAKKFDAKQVRLQMQKRIYDLGG